MLCPDWSCSLNVHKTARDGLLANQFQACVPFSIYLSIPISVYILDMLDMLDFEKMDSCYSLFSWKGSINLFGKFFQSR